MKIQPKVRNRHSGLFLYTCESSNIRTTCRASGAVQVRGTKDAFGLNLTQHTETDIFKVTYTLKYNYCMQGNGTRYVPMISECDTLPEVAWAYFWGKCQSILNYPCRHGRQQHAWACLLNLLLVCRPRVPVSVARAAPCTKARNEPDQSGTCIESNSRQEHRHTQHKCTVVSCIKACLV